jgi:predicted ATPase/energy-coupling factor transporter ATP-binding protein EcfA2
MDAMQKLIIKSQFMGVKPCEIELRKFLLLIGEQASGKSTIAKLIYFFQTLPDAVYENAVLAYGRKEEWHRLGPEIMKVATEKFLEMFGALPQHARFKIVFHYDKTHQTYLEVIKNQDGFIQTQFHSTKGYDLEQLVNSHFINNQVNATREDEIRFREHLLGIINDQFSRKNSRFSYLISGRNTVVSFPDIFEKTAAIEIKKLIEDEVKKENFQKKLQLANDRLLLQFVEYSKEVRDFFKNNGQTFKEASRYLENKIQLSELENIVTIILKGNYSSDNSGESITIEGDSQTVHIKDASSGQQEVLRILQGIFLAMGLPNRKELLIVEEPEAHLFPLAQKELINAFALFLNTIPEGRLIITTHSPYILACVNILLMANYTANQNGEALRRKVGESVEQDFWLKSEAFNAYALGGEWTSKTR